MPLSQVFGTILAIATWIQEPNTCRCGFRQALTYDSCFTDSRGLGSCLRELGHAHLAYSTIKDQFALPKKTERQKLMIPLVESS